MKECYEALLAGNTLIYYGDGQEVALDKDGNLTAHYMFNHFFDWYIKPKHRVLYVNEYEHGHLRGEFRAFSSENYAMLGRVSNGYVRTVKYIEVTNEE